MDDPYSVLLTSEQRRIELSQQLQRLMSHSNKSDRLKEIQLKSQMESIRSQRQKSLERNQMIRRQMQQFEITMSSVAAKTQALRSMKNEYEEYIERLYPQWKEQVLTKAAKQRDKEQRLMSMRRDISLSQELPPPGSSLLSHINDNCASRCSHTTSRCRCHTRSSSQACGPNHLVPDTLSVPSSSCACSCSIKSSSTLSLCSSTSPVHTILRPLRFLVPTEEGITPTLQHRYPPAHQAALSRFKDALHSLRSLYESSNLNGYHNGGQQSGEQNVSHQNYSEMPIPHRSSTPEFSRSTLVARNDRGPLTASQQSINSEKSVKFDESSLRSSTDLNNGAQLRSVNATNSRNSPRRHTPSPSELIRSSLEFGDASSQNSTSSFKMSTSAAANSPQHPPVTPSSQQKGGGGVAAPYHTVSAEQHLPPNQQLTHLPDRTDYSPYIRVSSQPPTQRMSGVTGAPAHGMSDVTGAPAQVMSGVTGSHDMAGVTGTHDMAGVTGSHDMAGTSSRALTPQLSTESVTFGSVDSPSNAPRRMSGPEVVIPSTSGGVSDDIDSLIGSVDEEELNEAHKLANDYRDGHPSQSASVPAYSPARYAPEIVSHSFSSLNTTATEEPPAVDLAKTDEFKSLLGGQTSAQGEYESDDSEDSMVKAIENNYRNQLALKTNTLPMQGPITMPTEARGEPSPAEGPSDDEEEELTSPIGYTPSFASNVKPAASGSIKAATDTKYIDSLQTLSSTGDSKNSSSSRRAALRRTNSDVESESDFQANAKKGAGKGADDELDDDDFYG